MSQETHTLSAGSGGQWEVTHYRSEIARRLALPEGDVDRAPATIEALHRKLARVIAKHGDPAAQEGS